MPTFLATDPDFVVLPDVIMGKPIVSEDISDVSTSKTPLAARKARQDKEDDVTKRVLFTSGEPQTTLFGRVQILRTLCRTGFHNSVSSFTPCRPCRPPVDPVDYRGSTGSTGGEITKNRNIESISTGGAK